MVTKLTNDIKFPALDVDLASVTQFKKTKEKCPNCGKNLDEVYSPNYPALGSALYCKHCEESY